MYEFDIAAVILGHTEGMLASASIRSFREAVHYARDHGARVQCVAILDNPDSDTIDVFATEGKDWLDIHHVSFGDSGLARNYSANLVRAKYICNLDSDDLWSHNWVYNAWKAAEESQACAIYHPRLNFYFNSDTHVFRHVSTSEPEFCAETLAFTNYWTSLCFCPVEVIRKIPYPKSEITSGIGFEDWSWNMSTFSSGIAHIAVDDTAHFIRRRSNSVSRTSVTNENVPAKNRYLVDLVASGITS